MYVRRKDLKVLEDNGRAPWSFRTKLEMAAELVEWCIVLFQTWFQKRVMVVVDGAYAKKPFLSRMLKAGAVVVSRLRKDTALFDLPKPVKRRGKGRPRKYGRRRLSLAHRGGHRRGWTTLELVLYGVAQQVTFKTFLATYPPAGGVIRVVIVKCFRPGTPGFNDSSLEWVASFRTDPTVSAETIIQAVADRAAIEQNFHDVKEAHGAGQQQVRNVWRNVACWNLCYFGGIVVLASIRNDAEAAKRPTVGRPRTSTESRRPPQNAEKTGASRNIFSASPPASRSTKN